MDPITPTKPSRDPAHLKSIPRPLSLRQRSISDFGASASHRRTESKPISDFQSDDVLNASGAPPYHSPPPSGPIAHIDLGTPPSTIVDLSLSPHVGPVKDGQGLSPVDPSGYNPFQAPGLANWTRETWGKRKVALISGITGQGGGCPQTLVFTDIMCRWVVSNRVFVLTISCYI